MMPRALVLTVLLLSAVATLTPLAYASPPDPTWIAGLWDYGDYDDIIFRITSDVGTVELHLVSDGRPVLAVVRDLPHADERPAPLGARSSPLTRAPPVS